jgi:hypothetical protein
MLPAEELTINIDALARMPSLFRKLSSDLADRIHDVCEEVRGLKNGTTYQFFDIKSEYDINYDSVRHQFSKHPTRDRETAYTLAKLSGHKVRVRQDPKGRTLLDYRSNLPEDFFSSTPAAGCGPPTDFGGGIGGTWWNAQRPLRAIRISTSTSGIQAEAKTPFGTIGPC